MAKSARRNDTVFSRIFDVFNVIFLAAVAAITVLPFIYVLACSFATEREILEKPFFIIPSEIQIESYKYIFSSSTLPRAFINTVYITVVGTFIALFFNITLAYPLAKQRIMGRNVILSLITFTLVFGGGMIPTFLVVKGLGLIDSLWSLMLPGAISTWNLIIIKNFFQGIPAELEEAAKIDGAGDMRVLWQIVLPLSKPMLATFALFYAVGFWNSYTSALLYINDLDNGRCRSCFGRSSCWPTGRSMEASSMKLSRDRLQKAYRWPSSYLVPFRSCAYILSCRSTLRRVSWWAPSRDKSCGKI